MSTQEIYRNYQFCYVQNQTENYPKKWDRSETVVEIFQNDSYGIKVDGTNVSIACYIKYETLGRVSPNTCQAKIIRTKTSTVAKKHDVPIFRPVEILRFSHPITEEFGFAQVPTQLSEFRLPLVYIAVLLEPAIQTYQYTNKPTNIQTYQPLVQQSGTSEEQLQCF